MEQRAQISFEYLITVTFAIMLVIAAAIIATQVLQIGQVAEAKIAQNRDNTISTLMS